MTQANKGDGWTLDISEARSGGTGPESNRDKARRGGWGTGEVLSVGAARGSVMTVIHRREDGALVVSGSDGVDRVTAPGEIRTPEDADRLFGVGFGLGRWMRENAGAAVLDVAPVKVEQPDPAPGQVWLPPPSASGHPPGWVDLDGTVTIADSPATAVDGLYRLTRGGTVTAEVLQRGQCLGVATPHGRVMVGDGWRRALGHEFTVTAIASEDGEPWIKVRYAGGQQDHDFDARNLWDCDEYARTRYAPARAGERYRWRATGDVETVETGPDGTLQTRSGYGVRPMRGLRGVSGVAPSFDPAQWERLDPGQDGVGQTIKIKRPASVVEAERGRAGDAATAEPDFPRATGAALDAIASHLFGIERRDGMATAYRGGTERETDEALRARCVERLRLPTLDAASRDGHAFRTEPEPQPKTAALALRAHARDLRALFDAIGRALEASAPHSATVAGRVYLVMRDEMLFLPEVAPAADVLVITADTKHLHALRRAVRDAMANGAAYRLEWGNGLTVERVGGPLVTAQPAPEPAATHYDGAQGGPDAWRWEVAE